jgi:hypothetical protein
MNINKNGLGYILCDFSTNSSGHPVLMRSAAADIILRCCFNFFAKDECFSGLEVKAVNVARLLKDTLKPG